MPRPKLSQTKKLSEVTFIKLRRVEKQLLTRMSRNRRRFKLHGWSVSAILREGFIAGMEGRKPYWAPTLKP